MIRNWDFNCKDFGRCIDWLRLAAQSLYRISEHPEVFTAIIIINGHWVGQVGTLAYHGKMDDPALQSLG